MKKQLFLAVLLSSVFLICTGQSWISSNQISSTVSFEISSKITPTGEVLSYGYFQGTLSSAGGISITSYGGSDYYLIKFIRDGSVDWITKNFGSTLSDFVIGGLAIDNNENLIISGGFIGYFKYTPMIL